jgi:dTDP-4-dehydrorhamnose 3,5-epimerase
MSILRTPIEGLLEYEPTVFFDTRGYFMESYNHRLWQAAGVETTFVQDNEARSTKGVLRGLHYQVGPSAQAKLVRVLEGAVLDVAVDLRAGSATYGQWYSVVLSAENRKQLFVPRGFAHGYLVLTDTAVFFYKCDNYYDKAAEGGVRFDDPVLGINWGFDLSGVLVSEKDQHLPGFGAHRAP